MPDDAARMADDAALAEAPNVDAAPAAAEAWMVHWLTDEAWRIKNPRVLVRAVCDRLLAVGVPIENFAAFIFTLHPDYFGVVHRWLRDTGEVSTTLGSYEIINTHVMERSPIKAIREGASAVRWRIDTWGSHPEHEVINDLRMEGATDYVGMRLPFQDDTPNAITFSTNAPGGFTTNQLTFMDRIIFYLARMTEVQAVNYLATVLLDTYVGRQSGNEVLRGKIRRGAGQSIRAVILMTDLRRFTTLSDQLPPDELLELLNDYFDAVGQPVQRRHGEILKFIGDAMLAVFPIEEGKTDEQQACQDALAAVQEAQQDVASRNNARQFAGKQSIQFVAALHVGDVIWGNIGTAGRLDFTVIGPAVNLVSRLEGLTGTLDQQVLMSDDFVRAGGIEAASCGAHAVKGLAAPIEVFRPQA